MKMIYYGYEKLIQNEIMIVMICCEILSILLCSGSFRSKYDLDCARSSLEFTGTTRKGTILVHGHAVLRRLAPDSLAAGPH